MICTQCKTRNPIGNKFCRECGTQLTPDPTLAAGDTSVVEAGQARERVAGLLASAFALAEQHKPEAALPLAAEAAALLPESTSAHALLASLYEQTDQHAKAITAMERVVALNPDSPADAQKLEQMRRGVHILPVRAAERDKETADAPAAWPSWVPLALSGATAVLVLGLGFAFVNRSDTNRPAPNDAPITVAERSSETAPAFPTTPASSLPALPRNNAVPVTPLAGRNDPFTPTVTGGASRPPAAAPRQGAATSAPATLPALPIPSAAAPGRGARGPATRSGGTATAALLPPAPVLPAATGGRNERIAVSAPAPSAVNAAASERAPANSTETSPAPENKASNGYIRIQVGPPQSVAAPLPAAPAPVPAPLPAAPVAAPPRPDPMLRAQALQAAGRYAEAVSAYQQALGGAANLRGAGRGDAYQGMAASYQRMGNAAQARLAYQQAMSAYQAALGGPDAAAARQGVATCRAALEVLGDA